MKKLWMLDIPWHDPELLRRVVEYWDSQFVPVGAARHLSYEIRPVGGVYTLEEETEYWKARGARIRRAAGAHPGSVVFDWTPHGRLPSSRESAFYALLEEKTWQR
jgi:hypothetical protein